MRRTVGTLFAGFIGLSSISAAVMMAGCAHQSVAAATPPRSTVPPNQPAPEVDIRPTIKFVLATSTGFTVTERFEFADGKAALLPSSETLLGEVATVIKDNPDLLEIYVAGFASSEGGAEHNQKLSEERAHSVMNWLVAHGIDAARLRAGGFGVTHPTGDNETKRGREMNRRVEFVALKYTVKGALVEGTAPEILANPL